jgi:RIO kinase 1
MSRQKWRETLADPGQLRKTFGGVFDSRTIMTLSKLLQGGKLASLESVIKQGKESLVLAGQGEKAPVAIKVYAVEAANFRRMQPYLEGDPRFKGLRGDRASTIRAWAMKEFKNLMRARDAGVSCPEPITVRDNVLILSFVGDYPLPAPRLTDSDISDAQGVYEQVILAMRLLWNKAGIAHGDLSEYNILLWNDQTWLIDFSQSVVKEHPLATEMLERDARNIAKFFKKLGVDTDDEKVLSEVTKPF